MTANAGEAAANLLIRAAAEFLRRFPPFNAMPREAVADTAARLELTYWPKQSKLLDPNSGAPSSLYIVQRGRIESNRQGSDALYEASVQSLGPGELFPIGALLGRRPTRNVYTTLEDAFVYRLSRQHFDALFEGNTEFRRYCTDHLGMLLTQVEQATLGEYAQLAAAQQSLSAPLAHVMRTPAITCASSDTLGEVLKAMAQNKIGSMLALAEDGALAGIFTERDVIGRVALARADLRDPIAQFMTPDPIALSSEHTAYEAALTMAQHAIRHIPVVQNGKLVGIVAERDLFGLQRGGLHHAGRSIAAATTLEALKQAAHDIRDLTLRMLAQGVAAEQLTRLIAALNDRLTQRVIELTRPEHDIGDLAFCWLALGSEGRHEQTLATDQDNAIVFQPGAGASDDQARARLLAFAQCVNQRLADCGFPLCKGGIMAGNPLWCLSLEEWKAKFHAWVREPVPQALLNAVIFFDLRGLSGAMPLAEELRRAVVALTQSRSAFLVQLARLALEMRPPLGLLRDFVIEDSGEHAGTLDLKVGGIRLFVDAARVLALSQGLSATNTGDRLRTAGAALRMPDSEIGAAVDAFYFLQALRLKHQRLHPSASAPNRIAPDSLNDLERRVLKEAFKQARTLQTRLALDHGL